jgi:hypothetical protein
MATFDDVREALSAAHRHFEDDNYNVSPPNQHFDNPDKTHATK